MVASDSPNYLEMIRSAYGIAVMSDHEIRDALVRLQEWESEEQSLSMFGPDHLARMYEGLMIMRWAEMDGPAAMDYVAAAQMGEDWNDGRDELIAAALTSWTHVDPVGARQWLGRAASDSRFAEVMDGGRVHQAFLAALARHDAGGAFEAMREMGGEAAIGAIARSEDSVEGLEAMLDGTSDYGQIEVLEELSRRDPYAAADWIDGQEKLPAHSEQLLGIVADGLLARDVEEGVQWYLGQEPSAAGMSHRYERIVQAVAARDPDWAAAWLHGQPDTTERDLAEAALAHEMVWIRRRWADGFAWASRIEDADLRGVTVEEILGRGWDSEAGRPVPELEEAARAAGFGEDLERMLDPEAGSVTRP